MFFWHRDNCVLASGNIKRANFGKNVFLKVILQRFYNILNYFNSTDFISVLCFNFCNVHIWAFLVKKYKKGFWRCNTVVKKQYVLRGTVKLCVEELGYRKLTAKN